MTKFIYTVDDVGRTIAVFTDLSEVIEYANLLPDKSVKLQLDVRRFIANSIEWERLGQLKELKTNWKAW